WSCWTALADEKTSILPQANIDQWKEVGAVPGYMSWEEDGSLVFRCQPSNRENIGWPAFSFRFPRWDPAKVKTLPAPDRPFALDLRRTSVTDADLEGIGRFHQAQALILDGAHITKAVLSEIKQLTNLRAISGMPATDEWLKELRGLKSLETIDLS